MIVISPSIECLQLFLDLAIQNMPMVVCTTTVLVVSVDVPNGFFRKSDVIRIISAPGTSTSDPVSLVYPRPNAVPYAREVYQSRLESKVKDICWNLAPRRRGLSREEIHRMKLAFVNSRAAAQGFGKLVCMYKRPGKDRRCSCRLIFVF